MKTIHLIAEEGVDSGKEFHIPPHGARLGRSPKNDIVIEDPALSRFHCRFLFTPEGTLKVADLASSNTTKVNGGEIMEQPLKPGDLVEVGDTILKVVYNCTGTDAPAIAPPPAASVDLGLALPPKAKIKPKTTTARLPTNLFERAKLLIVAGSVIAVTLLAAAIALVLIPHAREKHTEPVVARPQPDVISIDYEKVEADASNIFRYHLTITPALDISIEIDDLINNRTVRKEKKLDEELVQNLIRNIRHSDFFELRDEYIGMQPETYHLWNLAITINNQTHTVRVLNRPEPDAFKDVREHIEVFGKNELGLWAIQFSTETLLEMAESGYLAAKNLFAERAVKYSNLFDALQHFQRAVMDLETVEPKPEFYADAVAMISETQRLLQDQYDNLSFQAERAIRLQDWASAAANLRVILEVIPDRSDDRNRQARRQLLDVEARIRANE